MATQMGAGDWHESHETDSNDSLTVSTVYLVLYIYIYIYIKRGKTQHSCSRQLLLSRPFAWFFIRKVHHENEIRRQQVGFYRLKVTKRG